MTVPPPSELAQEPPPPMLYHYTKVEGLHGILKDNAIHATHIRYLNDTSEFDHGLKLAWKWLKGHIDQYIPREETKGTQEAIERVFKNLESWVNDPNSYNGFFNFKTFTPYFCSFSQKKNLLSQWRAYCADGGYALGFSNEGLKQCLKKLDVSANCSLEKCIYNTKHPFSEFSQKEKQYRKLQDELTSICRSEISEGDCCSDAEMTFHMELESFLYFQAFKVKHNSFKEEAEQRIIYITENRPEFFKIKNSILKPYHPISLKLSKNQQHPLQEIWIGPMPDQDLAHASLDMFLKSPQFKGRYNHVKIERSKIPYRGA